MYISIKIDIIRSDPTWTQVILPSQNINTGSALLVRFGCKPKNNKPNWIQVSSRPRIFSKCNTNEIGSSEIQLWSGLVKLELGVGLVQSPTQTHHYLDYWACAQVSYLSANIEMSMPETSQPRPIQFGCWLEKKYLILSSVNMLKTYFKSSLNWAGCTTCDENGSSHFGSIPRPRHDFVEGDRSQTWAGSGYRTQTHTRI